MFSQLSSQLSGILPAVLPFIIAITILVFIHEYGHFWVARKNGVKVDVFSIGFGPELFGWTDKFGTRWRVSPLPFGGYVKFAGDADVSSSTVDQAAVSTMSDDEKAQTLFHKTPMQRIAVSVAGPGANYLFAIIVLAIIVFMKGIPDTQMQISEVNPDMNGHKVGLMKNDVLLEINKTPVKKRQDVFKLLAQHAGEDIQIKVERDKNGVKEVLDVSAPLYEMNAGAKVKSKLGVMLLEHVTAYNAVSVFGALVHAVSYCWDLSVGMLKGIGALIMGKGGELGGIGSIGAMAKDSFQLGMIEFSMFLVVLSVNLGLINLLPVPVLDGGTIMLCAIEAIRGKPLSKKIQERIFTVGLAIVGSLMFYTIFADLVRFKIFDMIKNLFA